ncbi:MAG: hypothetical protein AMK74_05320 [Nitrospira bacterium SM23_35]|nr:MAG: hypothetical protein AMK74_05320 [Nitrospira bacterium SM23_35]
MLTSIVSAAVLYFCHSGLTGIALHDFRDSEGFSPQRVAGSTKQAGTKIERTPLMCRLHTVSAAMLFTGIAEVA